ncbi:hypothetical protein AOLI_G00319230 [Acnodon oligacanthus]
MNIRMPESCVPVYRCGTYYPLWLNGPHPQIEDGVVTRQVCGSIGYYCCYFSSTQIRVKACPGNYYVYEFVRPDYCTAAYCTDPNTVDLTPAPTTLIGNESNIITTTTPVVSTSDPCSNYNVLDDIWRRIYSYYGFGYYTYGYSSYYSSHDDTTVEWNGWYRLYLQGEDAQIPEWCVNYMTSGGYSPLLLGGSHPLLEDGIVTREISAPYSYGTRYDPCNNYVSLDQPWRANNETGLGVCDRDFNWNGWYRLLYHGMNIRMPESCVDMNRCGTYYTLWLNGPHPKIEDGVVTRQVCANAGYDCCFFRSTPIRVKACPGNFHVYEFVSPIVCNAAYCTDASTISQTPAPPTEASGVESDITMSTFL